MLKRELMKYCMISAYAVFTIISIVLFVLGIHFHCSRMENIAFSIFPAALLGIILEIHTFSTEKKNARKNLNSLCKMSDNLCQNLPDENMDRCVIADLAIDNLDYLNMCRMSFLKSDEYPYNNEIRNMLIETYKTISSLISFSKRAINQNQQINARLYKEYKIELQNFKNNIQKYL